MNQQENKQEEVNNEQEGNVETSAVENESDVAQAQIKELNERYLRLYSEFDNYKKRTSKERVELIKTAGVEIIAEMIPVLDDFERAIKSNEKLEDMQAIKDGVKLIYNKFSGSLTKKGLEPMESINAEFNPDLHEAITNIPAPSEDLKGKVIDELEKGYFLHGKVIRFAKVVVGA